jgi:hypothetical protein
MADLGNFNPNEVPPDERGPMDPLPPGKYELAVVESDLVQSKSGKGDILKLTHEVTSGPFVNRKIWSQHNFRHDNPEAQRIGQREIANLCEAIGHNGPLTDSTQLHGIVYVGTVGMEYDKTGQYEPKNKIKYFAPANGAAPPQPQQRQAAQPQQRPAAQQQTRPAANATGMKWPSRSTPGQTAFGR